MHDEDFVVEEIISKNFQEVSIFLHNDCNIQD